MSNFVLKFYYNITQTEQHLSFFLYSPGERRKQVRLDQNYIKTIQVENDFSMFRGSFKYLGFCVYVHRSLSLKLPQNDTVCSTSILDSESLQNFHHNMTSHY